MVVAQIQEEGLLLGPELFELGQREGAAETALTVLRQQQADRLRAEEPDGGGKLPVTQALLV